MYHTQTHGHSRVNKRTRTYRAWDSMIQRCCNPNNISYKNYGAKGIQVTDKWKIFTEFLNDMGECPVNMFLDRKNGNKNYSKSNCRWVDIKTQNNNTARNVKLTHKNITKTIAEWAEYLNIPYQTLWSRYNYGWSAEKILTTPVRVRRKIK